MLKLVNKVLYRPAKPVTDFEEATQISRQMLDHIRKKGHLGLAAPQIGISKRFFVMLINESGHKSEFIVINPTIIDNISLPISLEEGCLSFPGKRIMVDRPREIVVSYYDGAIVNATKSALNSCLPLDGIAARCFQHEYDHLDGITMFDRKRGS
jgi:peptide deformylase